MRDARGAQEISRMGRANFNPFGALFTQTDAEIDDSRRRPHVTALSDEHCNPQLPFTPYRQSTALLLQPSLRPADCVRRSGQRARASGVVRP
jgi:hypothetical protein